MDIAVFNGDLIDGEGKKSGGTELITADRLKQSEMATRCIEEVGAKKNIIIYGTPYHTGDREDWEEVISKINKNVEINKVGAHEWLDINGLIFDFKHKVSSSVIPHGRGTALGRAKLWNYLWAIHGQQPNADIIIRSHVHYHYYVGDKNFLAMTTPALQAMGSRYGSRECEGEVHFGFVVFEISSKGDYSWLAKIADIKGQQAKTLKL